VCGKNIFKVKDPFTLEGHNFDIMQYNWIFKSTQRWVTSSLTKCWLWHHCLLIHYMFTHNMLISIEYESNILILAFWHWIWSLNYFLTPKWVKFSSILVFWKNLSTYPLLTLKKGYILVMRYPYPTYLPK